MILVRLQPHRVQDHQVMTPVTRRMTGDQVQALLVVLGQMIAMLPQEVGEAPRDPVRLFGTVNL